MSTEIANDDGSVTGNYTHGNFQVACDYVYGVQVSTVWLGVVDGADLFETMVFNAPYGAGDALNKFTRRYATEDEAKAGHQEVVDAMTAETGVTPPPRPAATRQTETLTCAGCGHAYDPADGEDEIFCSEECRRDEAERAEGVAGR